MERELAGEKQHAVAAAIDVKYMLQKQEVDGEEEEQKIMWLLEME